MFGDWFADFTVLEAIGLSDPSHACGLQTVPFPNYNSYGSSREIV